MMALTPVLLSSSSRSADPGTLQLRVRSRVALPTIRRLRYTAIAAVATHTPAPMYGLVVLER